MFEPPPVRLGEPLGDGDMGEWEVVGPPQINSSGRSWSHTHYCIDLRTTYPTVMELDINNIEVIKL